MPQFQLPNSDKNWWGKLPDTIGNQLRVTEVHNYLVVIISLYRI